MGRAKEMMMDWDSGIMHTFDKDKYVCTKHFDDPYLNKYIQDNADLPLANSFYDEEEEEIPGFSRAGAYILPKQAEQYDDALDIMYNYGLYTTNNQLNEDIDKELSYAWDYFSKIVRTKKRYIFFQDPHFLRQEEWKDDVLTEINQICGDILVSQLPKGTVIYRGREFLCFMVH